MAKEFIKELKNYYSEQMAKASDHCLWKEQYAQNNFQEAVDIIEAELERITSCDINEQFEKKLWWTICHLELNQLPLVALSSPLLEIKENNSFKNKDLMISTLLLATEKLSEKNQLRLALSIIEKAFTLAQNCSEFSTKNLLLLNKFFIQILEEEIEKNINRREAKEYVTKLEQKLTAQKNIPFKQEKTVLIQSSLEKETAEPFDKINLDFRTSGPIIREKENSSNLIQKLFVVVSIIALVYFSWPQINELINKEDSKNYSFLSAINFQFPSNSQAEIPEIKIAVLEKNISNSSLDKVSERLKSINQASENGKKDLDQLSSSPEVDQAALTSKESLALKKTSSDQEVVPLTPPEPVTEPTLSAKNPSLESQKMEKMKVENLDQQPATTSPDFRIGKSGRSYGPPRTVDPTLDPSGHAGKAVDLNGAPLKSYEVNQYPETILYRTIAPTNVFSAPSIVASTISRLNPDTSIHVVSEMGRWLELESRNGKRGYIYAQDAVKAE